MMLILKRLLPSILATDMSTAPSRRAEKETANSGRVVAKPMSKLPTKPSPHPVMSAISLPTNASHVPAPITNTAAIAQ
ncbi:MAG: hypothetical protein DDT26_01901 [Dehalococcoidia bacterium]|nr:hypothetical protein [Chloroflexota bacterium]